MYLALVIATMGTLNHSASMDVIHSINQSLFIGVDWVEFVDAPFSCMYHNHSCLGSYSTKWDKYHNCYDSRILVYGDSFDMKRRVLLHELGHHDDFCNLGLDNSSEISANKFLNR